MGPIYLSNYKKHKSMLTVHIKNLTVGLIIVTKLS